MISLNFLSLLALYADPWVIMFRPNEPKNVTTVCTVNLDQISEADTVGELWEL